MSIAIEFNNVWKKYKRGEKLNSLRDAIPNFFKAKLTKDAAKAELGKQEFWAVQDVDFKIKKGEVVGLIGPNGAGKSTILKLLSGIIVPNKGSLKVNGRLSALIEVTAGFHNDLTGRENIYLNGTILGMKKKEIDERLEEIIEFSGIREFIDTPVKRYSSGMMSRLGFSVAAHINPDVLLVDEVLAVGDISFQSKCASKMRELLKSGATIVIVSHHLALIQSLCSRVILIDHGQIVKQGSCEEVIPYYENLVFKQMELMLKYKISAEGKHLSKEEKQPVTIDGVKFLTSSGKQKTDFKIGEVFDIAIEFDAHEPIEKPVFSVEIIRADGIICCYSDSKEGGLAISKINGKGSVKVALTDMKLAAGIYMVKVSVWHDDMIHPIVMRKEDILRIEVDAKGNSLNVIFLTKATWKK